jgi:O-antigen ligase
MTFISLLITLIAIPLTWWRPSIGLALSANAYLITGSLFAQSGDAENNNLLNILLPVVVLLLILTKAFPRLRQYQFHPIDLILGILGAWLFLSSIQTPEMAKGIDITIRYFILGSSFYFFSRLIPLANPKHIKSEISLTLVTYWVMAMILGTIAFYNLVAKGYTFSRISVGNINPIPFALLIASGIIVNAYWLIGSRKLVWQVKVGLFASIGFLMLILMASNTRSMVIALIVALPVMVFQIIQKQAVTKSIWMLVIAAIGIVAIFAGIAAWQPELYENWVGRLSLITSEKKGASVDERFEAYDLAWALFQKSPIFGIGTGNFSAASKNTISYAHNLSLELLSEQGIIGFLIFLCLVGFAMHLVFKANKVAATYPVIYLFSSWSILCIIVSQFSFTLWQQKNLFLSLGMLVTAYYYQLDTAKKTRPRFFVQSQIPN